MSPMTSGDNKIHSLSEKQNSKRIKIRSDIRCHVLTTLLYVVLVQIFVFPCNTTASITNQNEWDMAFEELYGEKDPMLDIQNANEEGEFAWQAHYWIRAYVSMAQTFNDTKYLDKAVTLIDFLLYNRDDARYARGELDLQNNPYFSAPPYYLNHRNEAAPGWRIWSEVDQGWRILTVDSGQITQAIMRFVDLVYTNIRFFSYQSVAEKYIQRVEETIRAHNDEFVFNRFDGLPGSYYYPDPDGTGLYGGAIEFNQSATMGVTLLLLDKVKGGASQYRQKAEAILDYIQLYLRITSNNSYSWDYHPYNPSVLSDANISNEDFNHAHLDLDFLYLAYHRNMDLDGEAMNRFANTLVKTIYKGNGELAWSVDGTATSSQKNYWPVGFGWIDLTEFNSQVLQIALEVYNKHYSDPTWARPFLGWAEILKWSTFTKDLTPPQPPHNLKINLEINN